MHAPACKEVSYLKTFMDEDFLLETEAARKLFHEYAKEMPIFDYHCHLSAKEIAENKTFKNITEVWLDGDHYKWRALRSNGINEDFITGNKTDREKFQVWAETIPHCVGNPLYHWTHLELQRCFGIAETLNEKTAETIWEMCNKVIEQGDFTARELLHKFNVKALCTTDDPLDSLEYHQALRDDRDFDVDVLPTFRPDGALNVEKESFIGWIKELQDITSITVDSFHHFLDALKLRVSFFHEVGCRLSDHGLDSSFFLKVSDSEAEEIFKKRLSEEELSIEEIIKLKTAILINLGKMYEEFGWAMQLHIGALRNNNTRMLHSIGPNTGFDSIADFSYAGELSLLLDELEKDKSLPKTIIYNLNPRDNYVIGSMIGNFQADSPGKIQFGTAWWFNDNKDGMEEQIKALANLGVLSRFVGMVTDSRSFLSYPRHEYFRRILCNVIGRWVENGEYPADYEFLGEMIKNICYNNINKYMNVN